MRGLGKSHRGARRKVVSDPVSRKTTCVPGRPLWMPEHDRRVLEGRVELALAATLVFAVVLAIVVVGSCAFRGI